MTLPAQLEHLFTPFKIRNVEFRNRVMVTAHLTCFADEGMPTEREAAYFAERAKGGVALMITAFNVVHQNGWLFRSAPRGFDDAIVPKYKMVTDAVHEHGAKINLSALVKKDGFATTYREIPGRHYWFLWRDFLAHYAQVAFQPDSKS